MTLRDRPTAAVASTRAFLRLLAEFTPGGATFVLVLTLVVSLTEWVSVLLLIPFLAIVGMDVGDGPAARITDAATHLLQTLGLRLTLLPVLAAYVAIITGRALLLRQQTLSSIWLQEGLVHRLRCRVFAAVINARWLFLTRRRSSDFLHSIVGQANRAGHAAHYMVALVNAVLLSVVYFAIALQLSAPLTLLASACGAGLMLALRHATSRSRAAGERMNREAGSFYAAISEHLAGIKTAKSYGAEPRSIELVRDQSERVLDTHMETTRAYVGVRTGFQIGSVVLLSVVLYAGLRWWHLASAEVVLMLFLFSRLVPRFSAIQENRQYLVNALPGVGSVLELLQSAESEAETAAETIADPLPLRESVRLEAVRFAYDGDRDAPTLSTVALDIPAHATTALVGASGAGKSTIADIVMGLLAPREGRVLIDGVPLDGRLRRWRSNVGYVPQENFLFHDTIRSNLLWANPSATEADLAEALELAAADGFIDQLPGGIDTVVGDRGVRLSGGERQRIALARALLRHPALLVLDEATSALDSENEGRILAAIERLHGRVTILLITHRLATVRHADLIHVVEGGRVVESGSWESLLREGSVFPRLCLAQGVGGVPASDLRQRNVVPLASLA